MTEIHPALPASLVGPAPPFAVVSPSSPPPLGASTGPDDPTAALNEIHRVLKPGGLGLLYDLVSDTPRPVLKEMARESGRMRMLLLWLHAFEEPFYSRYGLEELPRSTPLEEGQTRFVSVMCCLAVQKKA